MEAVETAINAIQELKTTVNMLFIFTFGPLITVFLLYLFVRVASAAWFKSKAQSQTTQEK